MCPTATAGVLLFALEVSSAGALPMSSMAGPGPELAVDGPGRHKAVMRASFGRLFLGRIELVFFAAVALAVAGVVAYQHWTVDPVQRCEGSGNWWDPQTRTCGHVIYLPDLTHRPAGSKRPVYPTLPETAVQGAGGTSQVR